MAAERGRPAGPWPPFKFSVGASNAFAPPPEILAEIHGGPELNGHWENNQQNQLFLKSVAYWIVSAGVKPMLTTDQSIFIVKAFDKTEKMVKLVVNVWASIWKDCKTWICLKHPKVLGFMFRRGYQAWQQIIIGYEWKQTLVKMLSPKALPIQSVELVKSYAYQEMNSTN